MHEEYGQQWAKRMIDLLLQIKKSRESCSGESFCEKELSEFESAYRSIVQVGLQANPPPEPPKEKRRGRVKKSKPRNLLERLRDYERATLAFMYDFSVPFDNNLGLSSRYYYPQDSSKSLPDGLNPRLAA